MIQKRYAFLFLLISVLLAGCQLSQKAAPTQPATDAGGQTGQQTLTTQPTLVSTPLPTVSLSLLPTLANLPQGWSQIDPGGKTTCAYGGKYSFFVRKASSDKLLIYFEGGGSCFDAKTCRTGGEYFDESIDPSVPADNPALKTYGIFDLNDARNPFRDYNIVFVSYCTGDAHMGSRIAEYNDDGYIYTVNHVGFENSRTVLEWTYQNFAEPAKLFVIGCSAGVNGSYMHAPYIFEHYRGLSAALVGDSGGLAMDGPVSYLFNYGAQNVLPGWIPQFQALLSTEIVDGAEFYRIPARAYPQVRFGLVNVQGDSVQAAFLRRFAPSASLPQMFTKSMAEIQEGTPNFASYIGTGDYHCITMAPEYYTMQINGVGLNDWFTRLEQGQSVTSVAP